MGKKSHVSDGTTLTWITRNYFAAGWIEKKIVPRVCFHQSAEPAPSGFKTLHSLNPNRPIAGEFSENIKRESQSRPPVSDSGYPTALPKPKVEELQSYGQASAIGAYAKPCGCGIYDSGRIVILERGPRVSKFLKGRVAFSRPSNVLRQSWECMAGPCTCELSGVPGIPGVLTMR
jgi:hypothetical protein